jgi:hypothetical protein
MADAFAILDSKRALEGGLFGADSRASETSSRIGDLILVARKDHILYDEAEQPHLLGLHGGLGAEEMLVPCLIARLDG